MDTVMPPHPARTVLSGECAPASSAVARWCNHLADALESDPVTSWTADEVYAALTRIARAAEHKRRDVDIVRAGRPPTS